MLVSRKNVIDKAIFRLGIAITRMDQVNMTALSELSDSDIRCNYGLVP
jgi:hypothetical protein